MNNSIMDTYARLPVSFSRGDGAWLWDTQGKKYLDALAGIAVCGLGHAHPAVSKALCKQADTLLHTSNLYGIENQQALADQLTRQAGMDSVFFCNSGAEANEAAIKIARRYGHARDIAVPAIIVMENSFHGRTLATLSATGNRRIQAGFEPLVQGFVRAPFNDLDTLERIAADMPSVVAILVEPIQGEGGINVPAPDYLAGLRTLADQHGWLLMLDEIQTGMGRTGHLFACQGAGVQPDVLTVAKALGNGVPIGACLARGRAGEILQPGDHGSTYGGNPLACAAALTVLETLAQEDLVARARQLGEHMLSQFRANLADINGVRDIRGQGLMLGIELDRPCGELVGKALAEGLLINVIAGTVVRLLPPLVISDAQAQQIVTMVSTLVREFLHTGASVAEG